MRNKGALNIGGEIPGTLCALLRRADKVLTRHSTL
jgi:hypothetical protein